MRTIRRAATFLPDVFGFAVIALVIAAGSCRFSRPHAQVVVKDICTEEYLRSIAGDNWHILYFLNGCWAMDGQPLAPRRIVIRGR